MKNEGWFIYALKDPRNGAVRYIGWTVNAKQRFRDHLKASRLVHGTWRDNWLKSLAAVGLKPTLEILEIGQGSGWNISERKWINHFKALGAKLTNLTDGGEGTPGRHPCEETRKRWSQKRKGRKPSPLAAQRSRELFSGHPRPIKVMEPMWKAIRGKKWSPERRHRFSECMKKRLSMNPQQRQALSARARLQLQELRLRNPNWNSQVSKMFWQRLQMTPLDRHAFLDRRRDIIRKGISAFWKSLRADSSKYREYLERRAARWRIATAAKSPIERSLAASKGWVTRREKQ